MKRKRYHPLLCICLLFVGLSLPVPVLAEKAEGLEKARGKVDTDSKNHPG